MPKACPTHMTVGEIIEKLREIAPETPIRFDFFSNAIPLNCFNSYRGYYEDLAISWGTVTKSYPRVQEVLSWFESVPGNMYCGWKGGEFYMFDDTHVWVAEDGHASGFAVTGIVLKGSVAIIQTTYIE